LKAGLPPALRSKGDKMLKFMCLAAAVGPADIEQYDCMVEITGDEMMGGKDFAEQSDMMIATRGLPKSRYHW
jgi:hypothetical protein